MITSVNQYFTRPELLHQALIHRSYCNEHPGTQSNERLEFLGDSVLSIIISSRLFHLFPEVAEGELTSRRSQLVQTSTLATKAQQIGLDKMLLLSKGEEDMGGRTNSSLLANTFEAVLGALFLDSGISQSEKYLAWVFPDSELLSLPTTKDPKSRLQEQSQAKNLGTPIYKTISSTGPDHAKKFTVAVLIGDREYGQGDGQSKQKAETQAASVALEAISVLK